MADVTLDQALPVIQNLAERKAGAFVRRRRLAIDECEDVQSHLVLTFIARWPKFDGEKASVQTFASRLMDKELTVHPEISFRTGSATARTSGAVFRPGCGVDPPVPH